MFAEDYCAFFINSKKTYLNYLKLELYKKRLILTSVVNESQKLVQTTLKLLVGFHPNLTEIISTKSSCAYFQHFPVQ